MRSSTTRGITLIEVVAGLTLMGTLLTAILVSGGQHLRQLKAAERKRVSTRMLDRFLATWSVSDFDPDAIPNAVARSGLPVTGQFGHHGLPDRAAVSMPFRVELRRVRYTEIGNSSVIRLTVSAEVDQGRRVATAWAEVLVPQ